MKVFGNGQMPLCERLHLKWLNKKGLRIQGDFLGNVFWLKVLYYKRKGRLISG